MVTPGIPPWLPITQLLWTSRDVFSGRSTARAQPVARTGRPAALLHQVGPMIFVHPEVSRRLTGWARWHASWPFSLERNRLARNPYTLCSCHLCKWSKRVEPRRVRERRRWRAEVDAEIDDPDRSAASRLEPTHA